MSQTQAAPDQNASASQSNNKTRSTRTNSVLSKQDTVVVPIPPSLLHSPLLASPNSVFRRPYNPNKTPREQDERWLADTVPIKSPPTSPQQSAEGSNNDTGNAANTTRKAVFQRLEGPSTSSGVRRLEELLNSTTMQNHRRISPAIGKDLEPTSSYTG